MSTNPKKVDISILAYDALKIMQSNNISQLIVTSNEEYKGIVHIHEIIKRGFSLACKIKNQKCLF